MIEPVPGYVPLDGLPGSIGIGTAAAWKLIAGFAEATAEMPDASHRAQAVRDPVQIEAQIDVWHRMSPPFMPTVRERWSFDNRLL